MYSAAMPWLVAAVSGKSFLHSTRPTRPNSPKVRVAGSNALVYARVFDKDGEFGKMSGSYKLDIERPDSRCNPSARMWVRVSSNWILPLSIAVRNASTRRLQCAHVVFLLRHCLPASYFGKAFKYFCRSMSDGGVAGELTSLTCSSSSSYNTILPTEIGQGNFFLLYRSARDIHSAKRDS